MDISNHAYMRDMICEKKINVTSGNGTTEDALNLIMGQFFSNPVFSGGAMLSLAGFVWYLINWAWNIAESVFRQRYFTSLELTNDNMTYKWVVEHINQNSKWETRNLSVESSLNRNETGSARLAHKLIPGIGSHYFYYKNKVIYFQRHREKERTIVSDEEGRSCHGRMESITLMTYGGTPEFWKQFIEDASAKFLELMDKGLTIYVARSDYWSVSGSLRKKRPLETVILDDGISEKVCADIETFISSAEWYHTRGVPYRRGYLLYGPPGTGKSSFIAALASHYGYGVASLSLTNKYLSDSILQNLINNAPTKTFILLEDIDVAFKNRENDENKSQTSSSNDSITLSGLLNAIDGIGSAEKRILFMTTNYKKNLDAALIRPGRVDFQVYLGHSTQSMTKKMFQRFYENVSEEFVNEFLEVTSKLEKSFSPAQLQKHFIVYKDSAKSAIENIHELL